jgi:hypothetical protein
MLECFKHGVRGTAQAKVVSYLGGVGRYRSPVTMGRAGKKARSSEATDPGVSLNAT